MFDRDLNMPLADTNNDGGISQLASSLYLEKPGFLLKIIEISKNFCFGKNLTALKFVMQLKYFGNFPSFNWFLRYGRRVCKNHVFFFLVKVFR